MYLHLLEPIQPSSLQLLNSSALSRSCVCVVVCVRFCMWKHFVNEALSLHPVCMSCILPHWKGGKALQCYLWSVVICVYAYFCFLLNLEKQRFICKVKVLVLLQC